MDLRERGSGAARHPWEVSRARFFRRLIADHVDLRSVSSVLDAGAGDGWFAGELAGDLVPTASITCWDVNYRSVDLVTPAGAKIERTATPPPGPFDLVLVLDVLEHLDDPDAFLADAIVPVLGGPLVVSVPAHPWLFSAHDRMLDHRRRYRRGELLALLRRHVDVRAYGPLFVSLVAPRGLSVALERLGRAPKATGVGEWSAGPRTTRLVTAVLDRDAAAGRWLAGRGVMLPGLSVWAVGERRPR